MKNKTVSIIIPYFSKKWPIYFSTFLKSCEYNRFIDILFITNLESPKEYPSNICFKKSTLKEVSDRLYSLAGLNIKISNPYLLCDYKPMYGFLFNDYIQDYKYWGYGDIDLIYGNLEKFISPLLQDEYDIISFREEIQSGSLSVYRNTNKINTLFKRESLYINALLQDSSTYKGLDETANNHSTWKGASKINLPPQSMTRIISKAHDEGYIKACFKTMNREIIFKNEQICFNRGRVFIDNTEIAYYHFVCNKSNPEYFFPNWRNVSDLFYVTDTGFYNSSQIKKLYFIAMFRKLRGNYRRIKSKISRSLINRYLLTKT